MRKINVEQLSGIVKRNGTDPVIFLGAGASATSGVPMAYDMAMQAARWAATIDRGWFPGDPRILESDVLNFLHSQSWFSQDMAVDDFYQQSMWLLNSPREQRRQFLIHVLQSVSEPSSGYHRLVQIVKERVVGTMLTTNFDDRFVKAFGSGLLITVADPHEYQRINTAPLHPQLIHLHGVAEHYMDRITEEEVQNLDTNLIAQVLPLLRDHPLIVVGYRGAEPSIMRSLLIDQLENARNFPHGIFWCVLDSTDPTDLAPMVTELAQKLGDNFALVNIEGFDQFMEEFSAAMRQDNPANIGQPGHVDPRHYDDIPFDSRAADRINFSDINETTLRRIASEHAIRMGINVPGSPDQDWYDNRLMAIGLLTRDGEGNIKPTNAAALLCANQRLENTSGNWLQISTPNRPPSAIDGSLVEIYETAFARLEEANLPIRIKGNQSRSVQPYGPIALKELLANALIHRDYESRDPVKMWIDKDFIRIESPGGLDSTLIQQLSSATALKNGSSIGEELNHKIHRGEVGTRFTAYRNPILAEAFWGLGYVDKVGSGLVDAVKSLQELGAGANLEIPSTNDKFVATANLSHLDIDESTGTAIPHRPTFYSANVTEFLSIPETIYSAKANINHPRESLALVAPRELPLYALHHGRLFTFANLHEANSPISAIADLGQIQHHDRHQMSSDDSSKTIVPELLRKALESRFVQCGMRVDRRRHRAYFRCDRQNARSVSYTTMGGRPMKRRVARWPQRLNVGTCEHDAVHYEITQFGDTWGLTLRPTYIVTLDGVSNQLPYREHASVVTRLQSDHYNPKVLADIRFWLRQLETSSGVISIDVGTSLVAISTRLITFEGYSDDLEEKSDDDFIES